MNTTMQRAPMCVCWSMFEVLFRRSLCALAGLDPLYASISWDDLSESQRAAITAEVEKMVAPIRARRAV